MTSATTSQSRRASAVPAGRHVRRHRGDVARWALAHGHVLRRDALAALLGARSSLGGGAVSTRWTAQDVARLLCFDVESWADAHGVARPEDVAPTLATYLRYLFAHRLLDPTSDDMAALRRAISENRRSDVGARARHPASARPAPVLPIS